MILLTAYENNGIKLVEGTKLFLLDNAKRDFVPVALNGTHKPFFIPKSLIKIENEGTPTTNDPSKQKLKRVSTIDY